MTVTDFEVKKEVIKKTVTPTKCLIPYLPMNDDPASVDIPFRGKLVVTYSIIALWVGFFVAVMSTAEWQFSPFKSNWMLGPNPSVLAKSGGMTAVKVLGEKQFWRLATCEMSHAGILHLVMNAISFYYVGEILEPDWGSVKFGVVFASSMLTASVFTIHWTPLGTVAVGGSGGVFGVMAAMVVYILEYWHTIPKALHILVATIVFIAISVALSFVPGVDWRAHCGGAIGGLFSAFMLMKDCPIITKPEKEYPVEAPEVLVRHLSVPDERMRDAKMRFFSLKCDDENIHYGEKDFAVVCDMPFMNAPTILRKINKSANRTNLRRTQKTVYPLGWKAVIDKWNLKSIPLWSIRIASFFIIFSVNSSLLINAVEKWDGKSWMGVNLVQSIGNSTARRLVRVTVGLMGSESNIAI